MYIMQDQVTNRVYDGKFVLGGHPDDAAIGRYFNAVWIDTVNGSAGTTYPLGTPTDPVSNIADAYTIATARGLRKYVISGSVTLDRAYTNWEFEGAKSTQTASVALAGFDVSDSSFETLTITGAMGGAIPKQASFVSCILDGVSGFDGVATDSGFENWLTLDAGPGSEALLNNVRAISEYPTGGLNINGANTVKWANSAGYLAIGGMTAGGSLTMGCVSTVIVWNGTNTGGNITIGGLCVFALDLDPPGKTFVFDETYNREVWGDLPWDETISGHTTINTFGRILGQAVVAANTTAAAGSTASEIRTGLTQADGFFNGMQLIVINAAGVATRNIRNYTNANGAFYVDALPFTPAAGNLVLVLARTGHNPLSFGEVVGAVSAVQDGV
jgi:hypothetical protein